MILLSSRGVIVICPSARGLAVKVELSGRDDEDGVLIEQQPSGFRADRMSATIRRSEGEARGHRRSLGALPQRRDIMIDRVRWLSINREKHGASVSGVDLAVSTRMAIYRSLVNATGLQRPVPLAGACARVSPEMQVIPQACARKQSDGGGSYMRTRVTNYCG
jgi:hypothetical protein